MVRTHPRYWNSHSAMKPSLSLSPRKKPAQARSANTVSAILDASIQVLLAGGAERLTTTRVAERAGVSVGTLYQYFPNKHALLAAVIERNVSQMVAAVEDACHATRGGTAEAFVNTLVDTAFTLNFADAATARALCEVSTFVGGDEQCDRLIARAQVLIGEALCSLSDRTFQDPGTVAFLMSTAMKGPIEGLLASEASPESVDTVRRNLASMLGAYLCAVGQRPGSADDDAFQPLPQALP